MKPTIGHKILFYFCMIIVVVVGGWIVLDVFMSGVRILLFGIKLMALPFIIAAVIYLTWHFRKFFR